MKPTFVYIGPPKSASSWLYEELRAHPQVEVPLLKDIYFFDRFYSRGLSWYEKHFTGGSNVKAIGELSHDYMFSALASERMANDIPEARLIVILRHPLDRALSEYRFLQRSGMTGNSFAQAVEDHVSIINKSLYGKNLAAFYERFPSRQIGIFIYNDLVEAPKAFADAIFRFIGVAPLSSLSTTQVVNASTSARFVWLSRVAKVGANIAREIGLGSLLGILKRNLLLQTLLYREGDRRKIEIPKKLFDQMQLVFDKDITQLEKITGMNLDALRDYKDVAKKVIVI